MNHPWLKSRVINRRIALLVCILGTLGLSQAAGFQQEAEKERNRTKIRQRIVTIIRETLNRGEITTADGLKVIVRSKPDVKDVDEIVSYGDEAVVVLAESLKSEDTREYELAMRLLSTLGGDRIVQPLREVILFDPLPRRRKYALMALTQAPWSKAEPIIRLSSETDHDAHVRLVAEKLLKDYRPSQKTQPDR